VIEQCLTSSFGHYNRSYLLTYSDVNVATDYNQYPLQEVAGDARYAAVRTGQNTVKQF